MTIRALAALKVTTAGDAGAAAGTADTGRVIAGEVLGAYIDYASQPGTTDVTLRTKGTALPSYNLLVVTNGNTDGFFPVRASPVDLANAAITNSHAPFVVADELEVSVAQGDAIADGVVVHLLIRD